MRCLLGLPDGTVWSGSTGKGGTHIWDAAAHSELQALTEEDGMHLVCAAAVDMGGLTTVWTGHTNGKVAVWTAARGAATRARSVARRTDTAPAAGLYALHCCSSSNVAIRRMDIPQEFIDEYDLTKFERAECIYFAITVRKAVE